MSKGQEYLKAILQWFDDEHYGLDKKVKASPEFQYIEKIVNEYEAISEQLGCPLEIFIKLHHRAHIFDGEGKPFKILQVLSDTVVVRKLRGEEIFLPIKDYKQKFWLKKDRSE